MRSLYLSLSLLFFVSAAVRADEATELRDKALRALAKDPADLKKLRTFTLKAKGVSLIGPTPTPATWEVAAVWPAHFRGAWEWGAGGSKNGVILCGVNDKGWQKNYNAAPFDLTVELLNDLRTDAYALSVAMLITLGDAETKLTATGPAKFGDLELQGLKVTRRPWPDINLYFDKDGLLRRASYRAREAGVSVDKDMICDGHKEMSGLKMPTRLSVHIQKREVLSWSEMEFSFPDKIDPKTFEKPK